MMSNEENNNVNAGVSLLEEDNIFKEVSNVQTIITRNIDQRIAAKVAQLTVQDWQQLQRFDSSVYLP